MWEPEQIGREFTSNKELSAHNLMSFLPLVFTTTSPFIPQREKETEREREIERKRETWAPT